MTDAEPGSTPQHVGRLQFSLRDVCFIGALMITVGGAAIELRSATTRIDRLETVGSPAVGKLNAELHAQISALEARVDALQHDVEALETVVRERQKELRRQPQP